MRLLAPLLLALPACSFSPDLGDGTLACGTDHTCPPAYTCGDDLRCHRGAADLGGTVDGSSPADLTPIGSDASQSPDLSCKHGNGRGCGGD